MEQLVGDAESEVGSTRAVVDQQRPELRPSLDASTQRRKVEREHLHEVDGGRVALATEVDDELQAVPVVLHPAARRRDAPQQAANERIEVRVEPREDQRVLVALGGDILLQLLE